MADTQFDMVMTSPTNDPMYADLDQEMEIVNEWVEEMADDLPMP